MQNRCGSTNDGTEVYIQNEYELSFKASLYEHKWIKIKDHLNDALKGSSKDIYINYFSANGKPVVLVLDTASYPFPYFVASGHAFANTDEGRLWTGIITVDDSKWPDFPRKNCVVELCWIYTVKNVAPTIDSITANTASIDEIASGATVTVSGTFSDPAISSEDFIKKSVAVWSDGITTTLSIDEVAGTLSTSREFEDDHPSSGTAPDLFTVNITINDDDGGSDSATSTAVTVNNVAPTIDSIIYEDGKTSFNEGQIVALSGTFSDPALGIATESFDAEAYYYPTDFNSQIVWTDFTIGDGILSTSYKTAVNDPHFSMMVKLYDDDGGASNTPHTPPVEVLNVPPTINLDSDQIVIDENGLATLSGKISDPGTQDTFDVIIDWGEGSPLTYTYPAGTTSFSETHQYLDDNPPDTPCG